MSKFKVGDKVLRTAEKDFGDAVKGGIYEVSEVSQGILATGINLVGHDLGEGYDYDSRGFELYIEGGYGRDTNTITSFRAAT